MSENTPVFNLEEELKKLPARPGVYLMHNELGEVIYVGKAVKLSNRVRQYFRSPRGKSPKILRMVEHIAWFEYILTDSEMEALVLECNLIKEYRPRYNTMLTDNKGYPFIRVTVNEPYPRVLFSRLSGRDGSRYFGPYTSAFAVKETLELLRKMFRIRTCSRVLPRDEGKERPCLYYHMGQCPAPCQGLADQAEYRENIERVVRFLSGDFKGILEELEQKMNRASEAMDFEEAIRLRDLLTSVRHVAEKQKITDMGDPSDRDLVAMAREGGEAVVSVFFLRAGKMTGRDHFHMKADPEETDAEILSAFVRQFYTGTPFIPRTVCLQEALPDSGVIEDCLSAKKGSRVALFVPKRGLKERLMELAYQNAENILKRDKDKIKREEARTLGAVQELSALLGIPGIRRMEAFDISNISGFESVGSMVVFTDGRPKKNDYRKFRIKTVSGPDDYASMEEVLTRRFERALSDDEAKRQGFSVLPDLLMMDGGKGQVHIAEAVLRKLGLDVPVCGMVKDDRHNTRGLYYRDEELPIDRHSEGFKLITRIQDEAHRFAITYHRGLHTKNSVRSVLSSIPGVGPKREKALMRRFENMDALKQATVEEIAGIDGFTAPAAAQVYAFLHRDGENAAPEAGDAPVSD
ncbi:MAG: excinuclease ABC subunit UvrC [Lachnospiraceae bacterium]|nr:excinuclease ABC subunit UvrC [Lachnospiraceae bacterium]